MSVRLTVCTNEKLKKDKNKLFVIFLLIDFDCYCIFDKGGANKLILMIWCIQSNMYEVNWVQKLFLFVHPLSLIDCWNACDWKPVVIIETEAGGEPVFTPLEWWAGSAIQNWLQTHD